MATEAKTTQQAEQEAEAKMKADAEMLDKTLKCLDSISKRMDAFEAKMDAEDKARRDAEEEAKKKEEEKADAVGGGNPETVYTKGDSVQTRHDNAKAQERADAICNEWGTQAPRPLDGEATRCYRARLLDSFRQNSPTWRDVDMAQIARLPAESSTGPRAKFMPTPWLQARIRLFQTAKLERLREE